MGAVDIVDARNAIVSLRAAIGVSLVRCAEGLPFASTKVAMRRTRNQGTGAALRVLLLLACVVAAVPVLGLGIPGGISVSPATATVGDPVTIKISNSFGAEASVASATIVRAGNAFTIAQTVDIQCTLPSDPKVESSFNVGTLPVGAYTVTATITFNAVGCVIDPITQTATFVVVSSIPALNREFMLLLVVALATIGSLFLKR